MSSSDVILPAAAANAETEGLITDDMLKSVKPTVLFTNITHPIFNEDLLLEMAASGKIGGYAFEDEKKTMGAYEGNVWNGPALGWCTSESMSKNAEQWVESIVKATKTDYPTRVN
jgi:lactate dehydrogenase-like 2-hydroxyacid dehydrogenase